MTWFDERDSMRTVTDHIKGKHIPYSVRWEAKQEYTERRKQEGASDDQIKKELYDLEP